MVWHKAMIRCLSICCAWWCIQVPAMAQWDADTLIFPDTTSQAEAYTSRLGINTFAGRSAISTGRVQVGRQFLKAYQLTDHIYNTAATEDNRFVTADVITGLLYQYKLGAGVSALAHVFRLDFGANRNRSEWVGGGLQYETRPGIGQNLKLRTMLEYLGDKRNTLTNWGPAFEAAGQYGLTTDSGLTVRAGGRVWEAQILPRKHQAWQAYLSADQIFSPLSMMQGALAYRGRRVEDYIAQPGGTNIQSILSDTAQADFRLFYGWGQGWNLKSINSVQMPNRSFSYRAYEGNDMRQNTFYKQLDWDLRQSLGYENHWISAEERFEYRVRDRAYGVENNLSLPQTELDRVLAQERIKDITEVTQAWYTNVRLMPGGAHSFSANSVAQLLRVDTRSQENNQDRDEVLYSGEVAWRYQLNRSFRTDIKASGSYRHIVYIPAAQSIENFKERILRLEPSFVWQQGALSWTGSFSLFVTYHVRDFNTEQGKNRSNRILLTQHQLRYRLPKNYLLQLDVLRRENRLGQLNWQRFAESPIDTVVIWDVTAKATKALNMTGSTNWKVTAGYRMFRQNRSNATGINLDGVNKLGFVDNVVLQHGPVLALAADGKSGLVLSADFWIQYTSIYNTYKVSDTSFTGPSQTQEELDRVQRNFFPNFTVHCIWNMNRARRWMLGR